MGSQRPAELLKCMCGHFPSLFPALTLWLIQNPHLLSFLKLTRCLTQLSRGVGPQTNFCQWISPKQCFFWCSHSLLELFTCCVVTSTQKQYLSKSKDIMFSGSDSHSKVHSSSIIPIFSDTMHILCTMRRQIIRSNIQKCSYFFHPIVNSINNSNK